MTKSTDFIQHLQSLTQLRKLNLGFVSIIRSMTPEDFKLVHSFPALTSLTFPYHVPNEEQQPSQTEILELLAPEIQGKGLTHLPCGYNHTNLLLASLPLCSRWSASLEVLQIGSSHLDPQVKELDSQCIAALVNLCELVVAVAMSASAVDSLVEGLCHTKKMKKLTISHATISSQQLATIVSSHPQLQWISLVNTSLDSLAFLGSLSDRSLTYLSINNRSTKIPPNEIQHLIDAHDKLYQLESLFLESTFSEKLPTATTASLRDSKEFDNNHFPYLRFSRFE